MTLPVALFLGVVSLLAGGLVGSICGMLGLALCDGARAGMRSLRRSS